MNKEDIKDIIDDLIYEAVIGKNPFKIGDLVKLRPDILNYYHNGPGYNEQSFYSRLKDLRDKKGKITKIFPNSKNVNVEYEKPWNDKDEHGREYKGMNLIGIKYTDLVPYSEDPMSEGILGMINPTGVGSIARQLIAKFNHGQIDRNNLTKNMEELMWRSRTQDPDNFNMLRVTVDKLKREPQNNLVKLKFEEGFGYVSDKDMAKDPKHIKGERWRIKFQSSSDLKKHGNTEKSKVTETINSQGIRKIIQELLKEMWIGFEEDKKKVIKVENLKSETSNLPNPDAYDNGKWDIKKTAWNGRLFDNPQKWYTFTNWVQQNRDSLIPMFEKASGKKLSSLMDQDFMSWAQKVYTLHKQNLNEVESPDVNYIIWAKSGPSTVYYVSNDTQGERMVQNAQSIATRFETEEEVRKKIFQLRQKYKGIQKFDFERVSAKKNWEDVWKSHGPKTFQLGHQILKPVKKDGEYVVKWMVDGKRDENKTYYTDDKDDANATYLAMLRHAKEENKKLNTQ